MAQEESRDLEVKLAELQALVEGREGDVKELRDRLSLAAQKYRALLLAGAAEVPEELVVGGTVEEVEASFLAAREVVEKVKKRLEARLSQERVPAGAPPRTSPDLGALSPREKIAFGLQRRQ